MLFFVLVALVALRSGAGARELLESAANLGGYFANLPRLLSPLSELHAFYLFWWFAWSIMIGQLVARFTGGLQSWPLACGWLGYGSVWGSG